MQALKVCFKNVSKMYRAQILHIFNFLRYKQIWTVYSVTMIAKESIWRIGVKGFL